MFFFIMTLSDDEKIQKTLFNIYNEHNDSFISYAQHKLKNRIDAEDAVCNLYVKIYQKIDEVEQMQKEELYSFQLLRVSI